MHLLHMDPSWAERMIVLEKSAHPRHKLCGGGVTRLGLHVLRELGFELPLPIPQARVDDIRLVYGDRTVHVRGEPQVAIFHRAEFDAYLAEQARSRGVRILENVTVENFEVGQEGVFVSTTQGAYRCAVLVGGDGSKGVVRRKFNQLDKRSRVARLVEVVSPAPARAPHFSERFALFDFSLVQKDLQGYFWDFPSRLRGEPIFNRGIYDARVAHSRPRARLPRLLDDSLEKLDPDSAKNNIEGHPLHWFSPRGRFSAPRLMLVGDAAGADPLFGEGIGPALGYGHVAAEALVNAFQRWDFSFRDYRWRLFISRVGRYLLLRWAVAWWGYRLSGKEWYMNLIWMIGQGLVAVWPKVEPLYSPASESGAGG
jgi:flavin-dependent dehydrogenase